MRNFKFLALLAVIMMAMTSCKYEEGPFISFTPKDDRVSNTWVVESAVKNGITSTSIDGFKQITLFQEGGVQVIFTSILGEFAYVGTWAWNEDETQVVINTTDDLTGLTSWDITWTILRLKKEELKVTYSDGSDTWIVNFKQAA